MQPFVILDSVQYTYCSVGNKGQQATEQTVSEATKVILFTKSKIPQSTVSLRQIHFGPSLSVRLKVIKEKWGQLYMSVLPRCLSYTRESSTITILHIPFCFSQG